LLLLGPGLAAAQATPEQTEEGWPELTPQACAERAAGAEAPRMSSFLEELVADGVIDQSQADEIERRLRERGESACVAMILYQPGQAIDATAELTETQARDVRRALRDGATLAAYVARYDVSAAQLIDAIMADSITRAAGLVGSGELTQAQADELLLTIEERVAEAIHQTADDRPRRWPAMREHLGDAAEALSGWFGR
jgi:hypothetical protein